MGANSSAKRANKRPKSLTCQENQSVVRVAEEHHNRQSDQPKNLVQFFRQSPLAGVDVDLQRDCDFERDVQLKSD
jgi:hypothetical protein